MEIVQYVLIVSAFIVGLIVGLIARGRNNGKAPAIKVDGYLNVSANETNRLYEFDPTSEADDWADQEHVVFKVRKM